MTDEIRGYPKVYALGHPDIAELLYDDVVVQEKVDGSQFSFRLTPDGEIQIRSKGSVIVPDAPEKMFKAAVDVVLSLKDRMVPGYTYRCEYLQKPKHNVLAYDRIPTSHLILFDVDAGYEDYARPRGIAKESEVLGLEMVPTMVEGKLDNLGMLNDLLNRESCLGGQKVEGVVIKNYKRFGSDKKCLMGKFVSEAFKEVHKGEWRKANPTNRDIHDALIIQLRTPARWAKAVQHLTEAGVITDSPKDIGALMVETVRDIEEECAGMIRDALWAHAWPKIRRGVNAGLAEWYKQQLAERQFAGTTEQP